MVEDTHDGEFLAPPPTGSHIRPNAGPVGIGPFNYTLSEQSRAGARGGQRRRSGASSSATGSAG